MENRDTSEEWPPPPAANEPSVVAKKGDPQAVYVGAFAFAMALLTLSPVIAPRLFGFMYSYAILTGWAGFIGGCLAWESLWGRLAFYVSIANFIVFCVALSQFHVN